VRGLVVAVVMVGALTAVAVVILVEATVIFATVCYTSYNNCSFLLQNVTPM
jgi:hypothetical protein